jgi:AcrR family transcriptional regulator
MARKPAEERKDQIVAATLRLADDLGPDRITTQAVADAIGLSQAAVFRHFPTKPALWQAVAEAIAARLEAGWSVALAAESAPLARLSALVRVQLTQIETNPAIPAILHSRELSAGNGGLRQAFGRLMGQFQALLVAEIEAGQRQGAIAAGVTSKDLAVLLISLVQGMALRWSLGRRGFSLVEEGGRLIDLQLGLFGPARAAGGRKGASE